MIKSNYYWATRYKLHSHIASTWVILFRWGIKKFMLIDILKITSRAVDALINNHALNLEKRINFCQWII